MKKKTDTVVFEKDGQAARCSGCSEAFNEKLSKEWVYCPKCGKEIKSEEFGRKTSED